MQRFSIAAALCMAASFAGAFEIDTASQRLHPVLVDSGGGPTSFASYHLDSSIGEPSVRLVAAGAFRAYPGQMNVQSFPGTVIDLSTASVSVSSIVFVWSSPGYDGGVGALQPGTTYYIQLSSTAPAAWSLSAAKIAVSTRAISPGTRSFYAATGLPSNTTYFMSLWTLDAAGDASFVSNPSTCATLAQTPGAAAPEFLSVVLDSAVVQWKPLPLSPSSATAEGYVLQASTNTAFAGIILSSATPSALVHSLAISGLLFNTTHYFRVGSLNWSGAPNFLVLSPLDFQIKLSTGLLGFGAMDPFVARSTVSVSSMVATNSGNWPATIELSASTATLPSSTWILGTSSGVETAVLWGLWNSIQPPPAAFSTFLTPSLRISQVGGNYAGNENAVQIAPGQSRTLWFRFWLPTTTISAGPQVLAVVPQAVYP